jgi:hypothetical protein
MQIGMQVATTLAGSPTQTNRSLCCSCRRCCKFLSVSSRKRARSEPQRGRPVIRQVPVTMGESTTSGRRVSEPPEHAASRLGWSSSRISLRIHAKEHVAVFCDSPNASTWLGMLGTSRGTEFKHGKSIAQKPNCSIGFLMLVRLDRVHATREA